MLTIVDRKASICYIEPFERLNRGLTAGCIFLVRDHSPRCFLKCDFYRRLRFYATALGDALQLGHPFALTFSFLFFFFTVL